MSTETSQNEEIQIDLGHTGDNALLLRFPTQYRDELNALLDEHGIQHHDIIELSAGAELWVESLRVLNNPVALTAMAAVIRAFVYKNKFKKIKFHDNGELESIEGFSTDDVQSILEKLEVRQKERDEETRRFLNDEDE